MPSGDLARDTIAAVATPAGKGGIGVVRVSGPHVREIARAILGGLPAARHATLASFRDARGERIDQGIALYYAAPNSYTGEPVLELQGHGGPVVVQQVLRACLDAGDLRPRSADYADAAFARWRGNGSNGVARYVTAWHGQVCRD